MRLISGQDYKRKLFGNLSSPPTPHPHPEQKLPWTSVGCDCRRLNTNGSVNQVAAL